MGTETGECICIYEPRGDNGLEGYQLNNTYKYAYNDSENYYKVYPTDIDGRPDDYCERCGPKIFAKYFKIVNGSQDYEEHRCCVCGLPAELNGGHICECTCPECGHTCFDDVTIADHGRCRDCHNIQKEGGDTVNEADEIKESIEINTFLTKEQIEKIIEMAVANRADGTYEGKVEIQTLLDAMNAQGVVVDNQFHFAGDNVMPTGTYKLLKEVDLGGVDGKCESYGCGHPIRFEEHLLHVESGRRFIVGNVCVTKLLGEHELLKVAVSLLAKVSRRVDKLNKAKKIQELLGKLPDMMKARDPDRLFTKKEQKFFDDVAAAKSSITIKRAEEINQKWDLSALTDLEEKVKKEKQDKMITKVNKRREIEEWLEFLYYKHWENKRKNFHSDFILNCIEELKVHDSLSASRKAQLKEEKELYTKIRYGRPDLMIPINDRESREVISAMLNHMLDNDCDSYFYISVITQAQTRGSLSPGQIGAVKNRECSKCHKKIL